MTADWTAPGAFEVAPGIWRIPLPLPNDGLRAVNVYAIADEDGVVLVDGGWALAESRAQLSSSLGSIGYALRDVREFLVTHAHRDHYSQAIAIRSDLGTPVRLGAGERESIDYLAGLPVGALRSFPTLEQAGAVPLLAALRAAPPEDFDRANWQYPDHWLSEDVKVTIGPRTLRAVETPGHTRGHIVFYDTVAEVLLAGDHVLPHITPSIGLEMPASSTALHDYLASLAKVRALPDARLLPAHGPVTDSVHARVDELLDHHERRLTATAQAVDAGATTAWEVANVLRWTRREHRLPDLDLFNQTLAVSETLAHLAVLVSRGWLQRRDEDGVLLFTR